MLLKLIQPMPTFEEIQPAPSLPQYEEEDCDDSVTVFYLQDVWQDMASETESRIAELKADLADSKTPEELRPSLESLLELCRVQWEGLRRVRKIIEN